jgi:hypothetical protein
VKVQILVDDLGKGSIDLGANLMHYAGAISSFSQMLCDIYLAANPESPDYLTISGATVSLKSRVRRSRAKRSS